MSPIQGRFVKLQVKQFDKYPQNSEFPGRLMSLPQLLHTCSWKDTLPDTLHAFGKYTEDCNTLCVGLISLVSVTRIYENNCTQIQEKCFVGIVSVK